MVARIIRANESHLDQLLPLFLAYLKFYRQDHAEKLAGEFLSQRFRNDESAVFMAVAGEGQGKPAGFVQLYPGFDSVDLVSIFTLHDLFVGTAFRRQGIGRCLMEAAHDYCASQGAGRVDLSTAVSNTVAQPLYESMGYERDEEFYSYSLALEKGRA